MDISTLGLFVQAAGVGLLALVFLYVSRETRNRVLQAMGFAWLFLFLALASLATFTQIAIPFGTFPYQFFKVLYFVALVVAAHRMSQDSPLGRPLDVAALVSVAASFAVVFLVHSGSLFYAIHMSIGVIAWLLVAVLALRSRVEGLGKTLSALFAFLTAVLHVVYVALFAFSAANHDRSLPFLAYTGFYDLFLEMPFGIGLIIWALEDTERKLTSVHASVLEDSMRSRKRAQLDQLTDTYNRLYLDENRPILSSDPAGGSIVLIDVDDMKAINDSRGHEEGDKAIWTVGAAIKKLTRGDDYVVRWGGDEFLVVLPGMDEEAARKRFYMLPGKLEEVKRSPRHARFAYQDFLSASVGVTPYSARIPFDTAIQTADKMMYDRKNARKRLRDDSVGRSRPRETPTQARDKPN